MRRSLFSLSLIASIVLTVLASQPFLPAAGQDRPVATPTPGWQLFLPAVGRPAAPSASSLPASPALVRRVTEWAAPMQLSIHTLNERPDNPSGDVVYRIKDVFTTRNGSWEVGSAAYGVPQWAREEYLSAAFAKAGERNNLFAAVIELNGQWRQAQEILYWTGGLGALTDLGSTTWDVKQTVETPGWASMVMYSSSSYDPAVRAGPWCYTLNLPLPAEALCGAGLPEGLLVSTFVVWQAVPAAETPESTPTATPQSSVTPTATPTVPPTGTPAGTPQPTALPAVERRVGTWIDALNVYTKTIAERPDPLPDGEFLYVLKDLFTTRDGSWDPSSIYGSIDLWAREAYLKPFNDPEYFDDAGADHHLFAAILDPAGQKLKNWDMLYWSDGFAMLGDPTYDGYAVGSDGNRYPRTKDRSGWANIVLGPGSNYGPDRGESGPWCWTPQGLAAEVICGGGMPLNQHISFFAVWQAVPRTTLLTPTPSPTPSPTPTAVLLQLHKLDPNIGSSTAPNDLWVYGTNLQPSLQITVAGAGLQAIAVPYPGAGQARARVPAHLPVGQHDVIAQIAGQQPVTLTAGYTVIDPTGIDLAVDDADLWIEPVLALQNSPTRVGLNVLRAGGSDPVTPTVHFYLGTPLTGTLIATATTPVLLPGSAVMGTAAIDWLPLAADRYRLSAVVSMGSFFSESVTSNNVATASVTVQTAAHLGDTTPPTVTLAAIPQLTDQPSLALQLSAADPPGGSGVAALYLVERVYNNSARRWVARQQTGWLPHQTPLSFVFSPVGGVRTLQLWVADVAGNISPTAASATTNLLRPEEPIQAGQVHLYRLDLQPGQHLTASLATHTGDADLYIWDVQEQRIDYRNAAGTVTETLTLTQSGSYQLEVHGYLDSIYQLALEGGPLEAARQPANNKPLPTAPVASASSQPAAQQALPTLTFPLYLPVMQR